MHFHFGIDKGYIFTWELPVVPKWAGPGITEKYERIAPTAWRLWQGALAKRQKECETRENGEA